MGPMVTEGRAMGIGIEDGLEALGSSLGFDVMTR